MLFRWVTEYLDNPEELRSRGLNKQIFLYKELTYLILINELKNFRVQEIVFTFINMVKETWSKLKFYLKNRPLFMPQSWKELLLKLV